MKTAINISNYEAFFLLYVDGELPAAEKLAVEQFAAQHPDLAVELGMLKQTLLTDEAFTFDDKNILYRTESAEINLHNYEEKFLLYTDHELSTTEKAQVETFVLQHPDVQDLFTVLKQTRLEPETVVFDDKRSLYRKEEKERRVFYISWQRLAVAAALIGVIGSVWMLVPDHSEKLQPVITAGVEKTNTPGITPGQGTTSSLPVTVNNNDAAVLTIPDKTAIRNNGSLQSTENIKTGEVVSDPILMADHTESSGTIATGKEDIVTTAHNGFETAVTLTQNVSGENVAERNAALIKNAATTDENAEVRPAVYKELDTEDEKKSLLLGSLEINKDKLRGFFRKAGSLFRGKAKADDDKTESRTSPVTRSLR